MMTQKISKIAPLLAGVALIALPVACHANEPKSETVKVELNRNSDGSEWDRAMAKMQEQSASDMAIYNAIERWKVVTGGDNYDFATYASFLVSYPGWPEESRLRRNAEIALTLGSYNPAEALAYFAKFPPITNPGRARYAILLQRDGQNDKAREMARDAWRGGTMPDSERMALQELFLADFTLDDHDERMNALIWARAYNDAAVQLPLTSSAARPAFAAALAMAQNSGDADNLAYQAGTDAEKNSAFIATKAKRAERTNLMAARTIMAQRPALAVRPADPEEWYELMLSLARDAANDSQWNVAYDIASKVDDAFPADTDISDKSLGVRDDYTSLTWLAGTVAFYHLYQPDRAVGMFARYGNAARTPQTRSKGFYWAVPQSKRVICQPPIAGLKKPPIIPTIFTANWR